MEPRDRTTLITGASAGTALGLVFLRARLFPRFTEWVVWRTGARR